MSYRRSIPERIVDEDVNRIIRTYEEAYKSIYKRLKANLDYKKNPGFSRVSMYSQMKQVEYELEQLGRELNLLVPKAVKKAVEIGYAETLLSMYVALNINKTFDEAWKDVPFSTINSTMAEQLAKDTMKDLLQATKNTEYAVKKLVQDTFAKHMSVQALQNGGRLDMIRVVMKDLTGKGLSKNISQNIIGIVDKAGRKWRTDVYVDMVVRTKFHQARVEGIKEYANKNDGKGDLAQIPIHNAFDACRNFEGLVISMTGVTPGYRTYDELRATNQIFHPRCKHIPKPIYAMEHLHEEDQKLHQEKIKESDKFLKDFDK